MPNGPTEVACRPSGLGGPDAPTSASVGVVVVAETGEHLPRIGAALGDRFRTWSGEPGDQLYTNVLVERPSLVMAVVAPGSRLALAFAERVRRALGSAAPPFLALVASDAEADFDAAFAAGAADVLAIETPPQLLRLKAVRHARVPQPPRLRIGSFTTIRLLGRGGMGTVYEAEGLGTRVALKVLDHGVAQNEPEMVGRFLREISALRALACPSVPRFVAAGREDVGFYCAMELVVGEPLDGVAPGLPIEDGRLVPIIRDVAAALAAAHQAGIVHRDVKPANVIVGPDGHAKLVDFGLAKARHDQALTRSDEVVGTAAFIAPELYLGGVPSPASDAFGLGMLALESALGRSPMEGLTDIVVAHRLAAGQVPSAQRHLGPGRETLAFVIDGLLQPDPERRMAVDEARCRLS
jgi:CheY-like chemotaxis protein